MVVETHQPVEAGERDAQRKGRDAADAELAHDEGVPRRAIGILGDRAAFERERDEAEHAEINDDAQSEKPVREIRLLRIEQRIVAGS